MNKIYAMLEEQDLAQKEKKKNLKNVMFRQLFDSKIND
jgi:hypothetical protein